MKKKIIITESQMNRLKVNLVESSAHAIMVKQMKEELDGNYEPVVKFVREGGEYFEEPMVTVKVDKEVITPKSLYEYMKYKYKVNDEFIKQVIRDWMFGKITDNYGLSKNVSLN
jgi:hypothetical protein